jgi:NAD(P)-dependent dehydrogenase (short-subunit alcohol dehydrogenase family)
MTVPSNRDAAVLVLGASRGLGRGIAEALARIGFTVGVGCRKQEDAENVSGAIRASHGRAVPIVVDVTRSDTVEVAVGAVRGAASHFAGLVNNAGVIHPIGHIADTDPTLWAEALHANLSGPYLGVRAALPHMAAGSIIVNVSSGAASNSMEGWGAYCCTKAGLAMLTRMIDHEYRAKGIHAYGFRPGVVDTDMQGGHPGCLRSGPRICPARRLMSAIRPYGSGSKPPGRRLGAAREAEIRRTSGVPGSSPVRRVRSAPDGRRGRAAGFRA